MPLFDVLITRMFYALISGSGDLTSATEHVTNAFYTSLHVRHTGPEPSDAPNEAHRTSRLHPMANLMSCSLIATYCDLTSPVPHFSGAFYILYTLLGSDAPDASDAVFRRTRCLSVFGTCILPP